MDLSSQQTLPVTPQQAWDALNDIELLRRAIPGCESIIATGEDSFDLMVAAAIGPVRAKFKGKLRLADVVPPVSYTMQFDGQGGAAGFGKGSANVRLEPADGDTTLLNYTVHAQVGGKIAQVGSRLVDMAAQKMAGEFFENFRKILEEKYPSAPQAVVPEAPAKLGFFARLWAALRRIFGSSN